MRKRRDIVFKRILTVTLAAVLTLETPLTAYAAQTAPVQMEENVEGTDKSVEDIAENDEITGEEASDESEKPGTGEEASDDSENPDIEEKIPEEPVDNSPEKDIPPVEEGESELSDEAEVAVSENSDSDNTLPAAAFSVRAIEETVTALSFDALSGDGVQVTLPAKTDGIDHYVWYSFTAPKDGRYAFYTVEAFPSATYFYLCAEPDKDTRIRNGTPQNSHSLCTATNYMNQGETLHIGAYTVETDEDPVFTLRAAEQTTFTKNSDGTYTAALPDGDSITLKTRTGKSRFQVEVATASARQYDLIPYYCPADHSEGDQYSDRGIYRADTSVQGATACTNVLSGGSYDAAFMIRGTSNNRFVALLTGMEPFAIEGANSEDIMYVHDAVCKESSIALDMESLVRDGNDMEVWCHAADSDEKIGEMAVNPWMTYKFEKLEAGTSYRFDIRDADKDRILRSLTYSTKAASAQIEDATAEISDDFSKLTIKVKPSYQGTEGEGKICWKLTDSLGRVHEDDYGTIDLSAKDEQGYFTKEIDVAINRICLTSGAEYSIQVSMQFTSEQETVFTTTRTVKVKVPEQASVKESDITFEVRQAERDEAGKPQVDLTAKVQGLAEASTACYFFRPVQAEGEEYSGRTLFLEAGEAKDTVILWATALGGEYEFILSVGGSTKKVTLPIKNELGVRLKRVEKATDETGAFHFVRTYEIDGKEGLTGTYYLQLQALPLTPGSSVLPYDSIGKAMELNQANGYQATVSTLDAGWVPQQDIDYSLRIVLSKTENISFDANLLAVAYENLHTGKPHFKLEKLSNSSSTSQSYQVSLAEEDGSPLRTAGRWRSFPFTE